MNTLLHSEDCGPCAVLVAAMVTLSETCQNAQNSCSPCNGRLKVSICGCECTPTNK